MKVLVTGSHGFEGNHLIRELLNRQHEIYCKCKRLKFKLLLAQIKYFLILLIQNEGISLPAS